MFENFLTTLKKRTNNITDSLKSKSRKLTFNFKIKSTTTTNYYTVTQVNTDYLDNDYLSPRACSLNCNSQLNSMNENMEWVPFVPPSLDEHNIVDRFIKVITLDDNCNVRFLFFSRLCFINVLIPYRGELTEKKFVEDWQWVLRTITTITVIVQDVNLAYRLVFKVVCCFLQSNSILFKQSFQE